MISPFKSELSPSTPFSLLLLFPLPLFLSPSFFPFSSPSLFAKAGLHETPPFHTLSINFHPGFAVWCSSSSLRLNYNHLPHFCSFLLRIEPLAQPLLFKASTPNHMIEDNKLASFHRVSAGQVFGGCCFCRGLRHLLESEITAVHTCDPNTQGLE